MRTYIRCSLHDVVNLTLVNHAKNILHSYNQFGGKGMYSYYVVNTQIIYSSEGDDIKLTHIFLHHSNVFAFSHQHHHTFGYHSYNFIVYLTLAHLTETINLVLHTRQMFQPGLNV